MTIKRILCASDFSPASRRALRMAQELARTFKAKLFLFHAYERSLPMSNGGYISAAIGAAGDVDGNPGSGPSKPAAAGPLTEGQECPHFYAACGRAALSSNRPGRQEEPCRSRGHGHARAHRRATAADGQRRRSGDTNGLVPGARGGGSALTGRDRHHAIRIAWRQWRARKSNAKLSCPPEERGPWRKHGAWAIACVFRTAASDASGRNPEGSIGCAYGGRPAPRISS